MEAFTLVASCLAAVGQLWFWHLHTHEQRSLWYGLSFLVAVGTAVMDIERIGDLAKRIASWAIFRVTGEHVTEKGVDPIPTDD